MSLLDNLDPNGTIRFEADPNWHPQFPGDTGIETLGPTPVVGSVVSLTNTAPQSAGTGRIAAILVVGVVVAALVWFTRQK